MSSAIAPRLRLARRRPARAVVYCTVDPGQTRSHQSPTKHLLPMSALVHPPRGHNNHSSSQIWPNRARCTSGGRSVRTPQPPLLTASSAHLLPCSPAWGRVVDPEPPAAALLAVEGRYVGGCLHWVEGRAGGDVSWEATRGDWLLPGDEEGRGHGAL
jgi:hypothetical protein